MPRILGRIDTVAKKSKIEKNDRVGKLIAQYAQQRKELKAIIADPNTSMEEKFEAQRKMGKLPRNSSSSATVTVVASLAGPAAICASSASLESAFESLPWTASCLA